MPVNREVRLGRDERRKQRQEEAAERQREWDMLSPDAKLSIINKRAPHGAHKEKARLLKQVVEK